MYPMACGIEGLCVTYYGRWLTTRGEMSPWSPGVSLIIGGAQVSLRESDFGHIFEKEGFIDALPQGLAEGSPAAGGRCERAGWAVRGARTEGAALAGVCAAGDGDDGGGMQ